MLVLKSKLGLKAVLCWAALRNQLDEEFDVVYDDFVTYFNRCKIYIESRGVNFEELLEEYLKDYVEASQKVIDNGFIWECAMLDFDPFETCFEYDLYDYYG